MKKIWIGGKAEKFLTDLGLSKESSEVSDWMKGVQSFYTELLCNAIKYFKPSLESKTLMNLDVLNPTNILIFSLEKLKMRFEYLARKWPNIIGPEKVNILTTSFI